MTRIVTQSEWYIMPFAPVKFLSQLKRDSQITRRSLSVPTSSLLQDSTNDRPRWRHSQAFKQPICNSSLSYLLLSSSRLVRWLLLSLLRKSSLEEYASGSSKHCRFRVEKPAHETLKQRLRREASAGMLLLTDQRNACTGHACTIDGAPLTM